MLKKTDEFSKQYLEVVEKAKIADYGPVKGTMIIRPYGYAIWEFLKNNLDEKIKSHGVENAYFPLFIPESFLNKEKKHIDGFSPELAVVTHAGGNKLEESLVVRPTSETIIYHMLAKWIKSYRDLPFKINQWANVVRWEMRTRPFLRTTEFLWQEGHTAHQTKDEALQAAKTWLEMYVETLKDLLAIPVLSGEKTESERFAGADYTFTMEAMMQDGKALQMGTSHLLSHSFPASFDVKFQNQEGKMVSPWCTSFGMTTRAIGAMIMTHMDDKGLVLPPKVAPVQVAIIPIKGKSQEVDLKVDDYVKVVSKKLSDFKIRCKVIDDGNSPGSRFFQCEQEGIPLRLEIGIKDVESESVFVCPRINLGWTERKKALPLKDLSNSVLEILENIQTELLKKASLNLQENTFEVQSFEELKNSLKSKGGGFYKVAWCLSSKCESELKTIQATFRVVVKDAKDKLCFVCKDTAKQEVVAAKSY